MDSIRISFLEESEMNGVLSKDFVMTSIHSKAELSVRLVFEPPHQCSTTFHDIISTHKMTQSMHKQRSGMGTLVVVDSCGGTEAAIYCSVMTLMKQLDFEHQVDVYQYVKITHLCKPGLWRHRNDLMRVYRVLQSYAETTSNKDSLEDLTKASRWEPNRADQINSFSLCVPNKKMSKYWFKPTNGIFYSFLKEIYASKRFSRTLTLLSSANEAIFLPWRPSTTQMWCGNPFWSQVSNELIRSTSSSNSTKPLFPNKCLLGLTVLPRIENEMNISL